MELVAPPTTAAECLIELEGPRGKLRIQWKGSTAPDLAAPQPGIVGIGVIQITPQMRILVAIEAVDGRKYAPSIDMQSLPKPGLQVRGQLRRKPSCSHVQLRIT